MILSGSAIDKRLRGKKDHRPAELVDIYPTLLGAAGIKVPKRAVGLDLLSGQKRLASFSALHERRGQAAFMRRTAEHKLILIMKRTRGKEASEYVDEDIVGGEFYDLKKDPQEWNDLYSSDSAGTRPIREKMTRQLLAFLKTQKKLTVSK